MDNSFQMFHDDIVAAIRTAEVMCLFFPRLGKTLIVDVRHALDIPAAVFIEDMVASPQERYRSLARLRPQLPLPAADVVRLAPWLGFVRSLRETEVYVALIERCLEAGDASLADHCRAAIETLEVMEQRLVRAIVSGELSRTLWERPRA
jgi:hypothetical protein